MKQHKAVMARIKGDKDEQSKREYAAEMAAMGRLVGEGAAMGRRALNREVLWTVAILGPVLVVVAILIAGGAL